MGVGRRRVFGLVRIIRIRLEVGFSKNLSGEDAGFGRLYIECITSLTFVCYLQGNTPFSYVCEYVAVLNSPVLVPSSHANANAHLLPFTSNIHNRQMTLDLSIPSRPFANYTQNP